MHLCDFLQFIERFTKVDQSIHRQFSSLPPYVNRRRATRARLVCDAIASMTDGFAVRTSKRLFDADFCSIIDLV